MLVTFPVPSLILTAIAMLCLICLIRSFRQ